MLQNGGTSEGTVGTNDPGGLTKLGRDVFMSDGTAVVGDRIKVGNAASLDDVRGNQVKLGKKVVVRGETSAVTLPFVEPFCPIADFECGGEDVTVARGDSQTLSPGSYGRITVGNGATLELSPGTYTACELQAGKNATIIASGGGTMLQVAGGLSVGNGGTVGGTAGEAPLIIDISGMERVRFGRNVVVSAFLSAPNARVSVGNGSELTGSVCAERLDLGKGTQLNCAEQPSTTTSTAQASTTSTTSTTSTVSTTSSSSSTVSSSSTSTSTSTTSSSTVAAVCGNGVREGEEECDDEDFGDATCASSPGGGFPGSPGGALLCNDDCTIDFTNCQFGTTSSTVPASTSSTMIVTTTSTSTSLATTTSSMVTTTSTSSTTTTTTPGAVCGNGVREGAEECDTEDFDDATCASSPGGGFPGSPGGALLCNEDCTIDFANCQFGSTSSTVPQSTTSTVAPETTTTTILASTTTTSTSSTTTTTTPAAVCGNGVREGAEECDATDFDDATCASSPGGGFPGSPGGALLCNEDCTIDFTNCQFGSTSSTIAESTTSTLAPVTTTSTVAPVTTSSTVVVSTTVTSTSSSTSTSVPTTCGNGTLDAGEECDTTDFGNTSCTSPGGAFPEPGSPSGALICNSNCTIDYTNCEFPTTTSTAPGGTTTTTIPSLGTRTFTLANAASADDPTGSHFYSSAINADASARNFVGSLSLTAGAPNGAGVASLAIGADSIIGFGVIDGSVVCARALAAGSEGKLDCDGGTAVGMSTTQDSNGLGAPGPLMLSTEEGAAGPAGSGYVVGTVQFINCGTDTNEPPAPGCSGAGGRVLTPADCTDTTKAIYASGLSGEVGMTTGTHSVEVTDRRPGSLGGGTIARTGQPFDCDTWETDGPGIVEIGVIAMDNPTAGDIANVVQLDD